jgi:hypothetical protein
VRSCLKAQLSVGSAPNGKVISPYKFNSESTVKTQKSVSQEEYQSMEPLIPRIFSQYREKTRSLQGEPRLLVQSLDIDKRMGKGSVKVMKSRRVIHHLEG